ncbi:MAG: hypothetical protein NDI62_01585 [Burkholderiales bacterium]|nr:hypothetical protein [Burkholderiales bacterium]
MEAQIKICQNCKKDFIIESEDFNFYEKIKVPPPTFCHICRFQRRLVWRNERSLYRRTCDLCKKNIIAAYHSSAPFPVYCRECWYGDNWDAFSYGVEYDFSRNFFEQYKELSNKVPRLALFQRNVINSDYSNMCGESKNIYLSASVVKGSENVFYSKSVDKSKDIVDCLNIINGSEGLYENVEAQNNYYSQFLLLCRSCIDSFYSVDCINCSNCFLCFNLRNKQYFIRNKQYSKDDYFKEIEKFNLKSRISRYILLKEFTEIKKQAIYRFANINKCVDVTGNNLLNVKNAKDSFEIYNVENVKFSYRGFDFKDSMDLEYLGWSELLYEYTTGALNDYNVKFSFCAMDSVRNADYTEFCRTSDGLFGCISLRNTKNAIFNKVYKEEEFLKLKEKIIKQMSDMPYVDKKGNIYKYGEFFPIEISTLLYNESQAQEFFPLSKEEILQRGYGWREKDLKNFEITIDSKNIPDCIDDVDENMLKEVLACEHGGKCEHQCSSAFRLTDYELKFYKKHNIPLPVLCSNCRYYERVKVMPSLVLYHRMCMKEGCENEFETPYAPDRPEKIYCEKCYQQEVY